MCWLLTVAAVNVKSVNSFVGDEFWTFLFCFMSYVVILSAFLDDFCAINCNKQIVSK